MREIISMRERRDILKENTYRNCLLGIIILPTLNLITNNCKILFFLLFRKLNLFRNFSESNWYTKLNDFFLLVTIIIS